MINPSRRPLPDNTQHSQQTNIHDPVGFEPTISAGERPKTYALDHATTGTGNYNITMAIYNTLVQEFTEDVWLEKLLRNNHCVDFRAWSVRNYYSAKIKPVEMSVGYCQVKCVQRKTCINLVSPNVTSSDSCWFSGLALKYKINAGKH